MMSGLKSWIAVIMADGASFLPPSGEFINLRIVLKKPYARETLITVLPSALLRKKDISLRLALTAPDAYIKDNFSPLT
jgi:hypothetical protein